MKNYADRITDGFTQTRSDLRDPEFAEESAFVPTEQELKIMMEDSPELTQPAPTGSEPTSNLNDFVF